LIKESNLKTIAMRKIVLFSMVLTILALMFTGCEKPENPVPPGPAPVFYTLSSTTSGKGSVNPDKVASISLGSDVTVRFIPEAGYSLYSVKVNNVAVEIQSSSSEVSYTIKNVTSNIKVEATFVETNILLLSVRSINEKPWTLKKIEVYSEDGRYIRDMYLSQPEKTDRYYFLYPSMDIVIYEEDGGVRSGKWSLTGTALKIGSANLTLVELTNNKFSNTDSTYWSIGDNCIIYPKFIYER